MKNWTRKDFLKTSLIAGGAAVATRGRAFAQAGTSPNGDIRMAVVGINGQGRSHMTSYLPGTQGHVKGGVLAAICDVDSDVLEKRKQECVKAGTTPKTYTDFRKLYEDKDVDAIVIATPNHWHSLQTIWALQAGKDVYCEKPLSHNVWEGRQAVEAAKKYTKNIALAGTQNRSSHDIVAAIEYIKSGKLGKIQWARGLCYKKRQSIGKTTGPQPVPASVDYDLWTGPASLTPPRRNSQARGSVHYDWHWFWNYGGGDMTNQGIHQMDVARWILGEPGYPKSVVSFGGRFGYEDDAETPNTLVSVFNYEKAPLIFETRGLPAKAGMRAMDNYRMARVGVIVQCENGYVHIGENGSGGIYDNDNKKIETLAKGGLGDHRKNWVKAVQDRKVAHGLLLEAHLSSALCHIGNVSYLVGADKSTPEVAEAVKASESGKEAFARMLDHLKANNVDVTTSKTVLGAHLQFDGAKELFTGSEKTLVDAANKNPLRKRVGRAPFIVPDLQKAT
jgi:predicted dehydrogenase